VGRGEANGAIAWSWWGELVLGWFLGLKWAATEAGFVNLRYGRSGDLRYFAGGAVPARESRHSAVGGRRGRAIDGARVFEVWGVAVR
jgi:hypothetical protein